MRSFSHIYAILHAEGEDAALVDTGKAQDVAGAALQNFKAAKSASEAKAAWAATGVTFTSLLFSVSCLQTYRMLLTCDGSFSSGIL